MFNVSPASLQTFIDTPNCSRRTVFGTVRSTFRMYSVMAILKSSLVWGLSKYTVIVRCTETFCSLCRIVALTVQSQDIHIQYVYVYIYICIRIDGRLGVAVTGLPPRRTLAYKPPLVPPVFSRGAPRQATWETSVREGRNYRRETAGQFGLRFRLPRKSQGYFTCRKSATWDRRLYFPSEERHAVDFFAGFGRVWTCDLGYQSQHANH
jgi:hypothetical protein